MQESGPREIKEPGRRQTREPHPAVQISRILTPREEEVVNLVVSEMLNNRDIAERLGVNEDTVKKHLSAAMDKIGCNTRLELGLMMQKRILEREFEAGHGGLIGKLNDDIKKYKQELKEAYKQIFLLERCIQLFGGKVKPADG